MVTPRLVLDHRELPITPSENSHLVTVAARGAYVALSAQDQPGLIVVPSSGTFFSPRYFGNRYFGKRYFG